jgi:hypothetical protein
MHGQERELQDCVRLIESLWRKQFTSEEREVWREALAMLDEDYVPAALTKLAKTNKYVPTIAEIAEVVAELERSQRAKGRIEPGPICPTCNGDHYVTVYRRPAETTGWMKRKGIEAAEGATIEEVAPCPDCGTHIEASYFRYDGTKFQPTDPAKVRELMEPMPTGESVPIPDWVYVRHWMRYTAKDDRVLPQQQREFDQAEQRRRGVLTDAEYEQMHSLWIENGSPKPHLSELVGW